MSFTDEFMKLASGKSSESTLFAMAGIFGPMLLTLYTITFYLVPKAGATWLPSTDNISKREYEIFALRYTVVWIVIFGGVIVTQAYESFTANGYMVRDL